MNIPASTTISLKDVARAAGKSPGTVSQVLNNRKVNIRISDETRRHIRETADRLGYRPNPIARSLRTRRTGTIGVLVNALGVNPKQFDAVERAASEAGYQLLLSVSRDDVSVEEHAIKQLLRRQVDGVLLISPAIRGGHRKILDQLVADRFPIMGIGPLCVDSGDFVDWDRVGVYRAIGEHLLSRGCRRIGFLGSSMSPGVQGRVDGLRAAIDKSDDASLEIFGCDEQAVSMEVESLAMLMKPALESGQLDAVVTQTDEVAVGVMQIARSVGMVLPHDLAVVGCSDSSFGRLLDVPLTTTRMPGAEMAKRAVSYLIDRIMNPSADAPALQEHMPAELLIRQSSLYGSSGSA